MHMSRAATRAEAIEQLMLDARTQQYEIHGDTSTYVDIEFPSTFSATRFATRYVTTFGIRFVSDVRNLKTPCTIEFEYVGGWGS